MSRQPRAMSREYDEPERAAMKLMLCAGDAAALREPLCRYTSEMILF